MNGYDRIIYTSRLDWSLINEINKSKTLNPQEKILIEVPDTKGISSYFLNMLNQDVHIRIAGAYDRERVDRLRNVRYKNGETGEYYYSAVIYTKDEAVKIVEEMEEIEKGLEGKDANQIEKLVYIYIRLKSGIMYDSKYENKTSKDLRSLRGLITKRTVCAGYAVILKELLDRQGIKCYYVSGKSGEGRTCMEYCNN